jgi:hypothetical protein
MRFEYRLDWYRDRALRDPVLSYYALVRSLLRERPELRLYLKRCKRCRIFFFTDPRNACRDDLRCGFGCRQAHRRRSSHRRSADFYREHPEKKRHQNRKRYLQSANSPQPTVQPSVMPPESEPPPPIVRHVRVIVSLIERRQVALDEIVDLLAKKGRQHSIARRRCGPYGGQRIKGRGS